MNAVLFEFREAALRPMRAALVKAISALCIAVCLCSCGDRVDSDKEMMKTLSEIKDEIKGLRQDLLARATPQPSREPTQKQVASIEIGSSPVIGNSKAKVAIVEFSDYQCPFCARHHKTVFNELKGRYVDTGKVLYVFKDFPLSAHPEGKSGAMAARCAGRFGAYWAMQRILFDNQTQLGAKFYESSAVKLGIDGNKFRSCLEDKDLLSSLEMDASYGESLGVSGTPSFFVGRLRDGKLIEANQLSGAQPLQAFAMKLDQLVAQQ